MNNRPLIYLNEENVNELLTPNHLIYGRSLTSVNENGMVEINEIKIRTMKVFMTNLLKQLMDKFKHEYLLALQQRHSYDRNVKSSDHLKIADVINYIGERSESWSYTLATMTSSVKVYQKNGDKTFIIKWPLQHLVLLDSAIKEPANGSKCSRTRRGCYEC